MARRYIGYHPLTHFFTFNFDKQKFLPIANWETAACYLAQVKKKPYILAKIESRNGKNHWRVRTYFFVTEFGVYTTYKYFLQKVRAKKISLATLQKYLETKPDIKQKSTAFSPVGRNIAISLLYLSLWWFFLAPLTISFLFGRALSEPAMSALIQAVMAIFVAMLVVAGVAMLTVPSAEKKLLQDIMDATNNTL